MNELSLNHESGAQLSLRYKFYNLTRYLISIRPRKWSKDPINQKFGSILHTAVRQAHLEIVNDIVRHDPCVINCVNNSLKSPLDLALEMYRMNSEVNYIQVIRELCLL